MNRLFVVMALLLLVFTMPAGAQTEKPIGEWETAPGEQCNLVDGNNDSVWPGNVLVIRDGEAVYEVAGVEDEPGVVIDFSFVAQSSLVTAAVRYEKWSSLDVVLECAPVPSTTTTTAPEPTTSTVPEPTTTTTVPEEETTTTKITVDCVLVRNGDGCVSTTTTTEPPPPDSTTTTTINENCPPDGLACTGSEAALPFAFGLLFVVLGAITLTAKELFR
jgi:hypothetical protein